MTKGYLSHCVNVCTKCEIPRPATQAMSYFNVKQFLNCLEWVSWCANTYTLCQAVQTSDFKTCDIYCSTDLHMFLGCTEWQLMFTFWRTFVCSCAAHNYNFCRYTVLWNRHYHIIWVWRDQEVKVHCKRIPAEKVTMIHWSKETTT